MSPAGFQISTTPADSVKAPWTGLPRPPPFLSARSLGVFFQGTGTPPAMSPPPGVQSPAVPAAYVHEVREPLGQEGASAQDQHGQQDIQSCFHDSSKRDWRKLRGQTSGPRRYVGTGRVQPDPGASFASTLPGRKKNANSTSTTAAATAGTSQISSQWCCTAPSTPAKL